MNGAFEGSFENRPIDFFQLLFGSFIFCTNDHTIWMKEIFNGGALSQKLRIGGHMEFNIALATVDGEGSFQLFAGPRRNRAFFDHQLGRIGMDGNGPGHMIDRAEISVAIGQRGRPNADKNGVALRCGIGGIGTKTEPLRFSSRRNQLFEARLINRQAALFQNLNFRGASLSVQITS